MCEYQRAWLQTPSLTRQHLLTLNSRSYDRCDRLGQTYYIVWLAGSRQVGQGVHQVGNVLFEDTGNFVHLGLESEEVTDGDIRPWVHSWREHNMWAPFYGVWRKET